MGLRRFLRSHLCDPYNIWEAMNLQDYEYILPERVLTFIEKYLKVHDIYSRSHLLNQMNPSEHWVYTFMFAIAKNELLVMQTKPGVTLKMALNAMDTFWLEAPILKRDGLEEELYIELKENHEKYRKYLKY